MKRNLIIVLLVLFSACDRNAGTFVELDAALEEMPEIRQRFEKRLDSLKLQLQAASLQEQSVLADSLVAMYTNAFIDSAYVYARKAVEIKTTLNDRRGALASYIEMLKNSPLLDILSSVDAFQDLDSLEVKEFGLEKEYVYCGTILCYRARNDLSGRRQTYQDMYRYYLERYYQIDSVSPAYLFLRAIELRDLKLYDEVKELLLQPCQEGRMSHEDMSIISTYLASVYKFTNDIDNALYWYSKSVVNDIKCAKHQHMSLANIAWQLAMRGDTKRALRYATISNEDALYYNDSHRVAMISPILSTISDTVFRYERMARFITSMAVIVISILLVVVLAAWRNVLRSSRKLKVLNRKISRLNNELDEANKLKENYMAHYMIKCTGYINEVDNRSSEMRRILKKDGTDALVAELHKPKYSDSEFKSFYAEFDSSFLRLFPGFMDALNSRVVSGEQWKLGRGNALPMELRLLAAMRIGITDSSEIAEFLNFPQQSIYTYRYRLKTSFGLKDSSLSDFVASLNI